MRSTNKALRRPKPFIVGTVVLIAISITTLILTEKGLVEPLLLLPVICITVVLGSQITPWIRGNADTFSLTAWTSMLLLIGYSLLPPLQLWTDSWFIPHAWDVERSLSQALWIALVGLIAFVAGMKMPFVAGLARLLPVFRDLSQRRIMLVALLYLGVGLGMSLYLFKQRGGLNVYLYDPRSAGLGLGEGHLTLGLELSAVASMLLALLVMQPHSQTIAIRKRTVRIAKTWLLFLLSILIFLGCTILLQFSRTFIIAMFLGLLVMHHYLVRTVRMWQLAVFAVSALLFAIFLGYIRQGNTYRQLESFTPQAMWANRDWLSEGMLDYAPMVLLFDSGRIEPLMATMERLPNAGDQLLWGKTYIAAFLQLLPRAIRPEGWLTSAGELNDLVYGKGHFVAAAQYSGSWATNMMIEGYLNFHLAGVILVPFFTGVGLAVIERYRRIYSTVPATVLIYAVLFPYVMRLPDSDFGVVLFSVARLMVPLLLALLCTSRRAV